MEDLDALLADLENTTSHVSKRPVLLTDSPNGSHVDISHINQVSHTNGVRKDNMEQRPLPPPYSAPQAVTVSMSAEPTSCPTPPGGDKDHLYSTVCKPKSPKAKEPPPFSSSVLGGGLCELDRLLQELNATQFNITDEIMSQFPSSKSSNAEKKRDGSAPAGATETGKGKGAEDGSQATSTMTPSATSATLELDRLMASLSGFRVQSNIPPSNSPQTQVKVVPPQAPVTAAPSQTQTQPQPQVKAAPLQTQGKVTSPQPVVHSSAPPQSENLDSMMVMLQSDLSRQGISTVAKGLCASCQKPIAGQVVTALGQTWHPEHFVCSHCQKEMGGSNFFEKDGLPYCERDYFTLFSPRCGLCNEPIIDKMVTALDKNWHPEHFCCVKCGRPFGEDGFHEKDGKQYCRQDFHELFATRCHGCAKAILENYISALNALWHPECFVCRECYTPFVNGSFFEHEGQPYCEIHYHKNRGSLCSGCEKPITGRCITAMGKKFHPEHFVCAFCLKQLNKGTFKEQTEKPYCHPCFIKLFG
ncbi:transforming growth factor beta-1-induced transcript 1 protein [Lissotriton helveticus]